VKLLVLGGTKFLGRAAVEAALEKGHEVTLFNRGETNPELFPEAEKLRGDRDQDLSALAGRSWDSVIDTCGHLPRQVRAAADLLANAAGYYLFVSSISVYADRSGRISEGDDTKDLGDLPDDRLLEDYSNYGALKALCERAVAEALPDRSAVVRPGLIVGPHDPTGRFTYWPHRIARGGDVVVPAPAEDRVQFIDVRDLGQWMISLAERQQAGTFNAVNESVAWSELLEACRTVAGSDAAFVWIDADFLSDQGVEEWMDLPLWISDDQARGMHQVDVSHALEAGLTFRPLAETVRATLDLAETTADAGLSPGREQELIEAWKAR
jgi:2'-hydroxyisoflavone reductase